MTATYISTKIVAAWPAERGGEEGYDIRYPDGYHSWCPKHVFERCYRPVSGEEKGLLNMYGVKEP